MKKVILLFAAILVSCTSKLDFDQISELEITPVFEADMFFFDIRKENLIDSQSHFRNIVQDTINFDIFNNGDIRDGFVKAEFTIGYENTFQRNFHTEYIFIDENNQLVEQNSFDIPAAEIGQEVEGEEILIYSKTTHPGFINFRKIVVRVTVTPDTMPVEDQLLHIKTKGKIYSKVHIE
jgi:hypothetical protein